MSLKRYAQIAEIIGGVAVVIGLVFVGLELRQNTRAQRVTATQTLVVDYENAIDNLADADAACVYVLGINGLQNLSGIERYRFFVLWFHIFRAAEQLHYYSLEGMIEPGVWRGFQRQLNEVSRLQGVREWWNIRRDWFSDDFQTFIDELVANGPPVEPELFSAEGCG